MLVIYYEQKTKYDMHDMIQWMHVTCCAVDATFVATLVVAN